MVKTERNIAISGTIHSLPKKKNILSRLKNEVLSSPISGLSTKKSNSSANIKVVVRVRPFNANEGQASRSIVQIINDEMLVFDPEEEAEKFFFHGTVQKGRDMLKVAKKNMKFSFDKVLRPECSNIDVFKNSTHTLITSVLDGFNCSVFAYGATGAGKTFTMTGNSENPGITFLTMKELFKQQEELSDERNFELGVTYLEVYNELIKDLLNPGPPLPLREDSQSGVVVAGMKVFKIFTANELFKLLEQGNQNRTQHPTFANSESSRSHAVFQVYIKITTKITGEVRTAKLSMIDLAGSERGSATGYLGTRFTEGSNINKSLLALGNCINSLADGRIHVPYRDSKLTRLLKDSLGGNCQTVMIANVSPSYLCFEDTYNTLKYAARAKTIKSNVRINVAKVDFNELHYVKLIEELKKENQIVKQQLVEQKKETEKLENECQRLGSETNKFGGEVEYGVINEIRTLLDKKRELMEKQFELEKNQDATVLRRLLKSEIENRISDIFENTPEKNEAREKIGSTIMRFREQENAFRDDIEKIEDAADQIEKQIDNLLEMAPQYKEYVKMERMKLALLRATHRILLEQKHSEKLISDHEEKTELLEKMAGTITSFYRLLKGHGCLSSTVTKQYQEISKNFFDKDVADCGSEVDVKDENKRRMKEQDLNKTITISSFSKSTDTKATKTYPRSPAAKMLADKSSTNKENIYPNSLDSENTIICTKSRVNPGIKASSPSLPAINLVKKRENIYLKPFDSTKIANCTKTPVKSGLKGSSYKPR